MKKELRTVLLSGALIAGTLGSAIVWAQTSTQTQTTQTQTQPQSPAIQGTVPVAQGMAQYVDMAKVSLADAVAAAQQATGVSANPTSVELSVEYGFLVWEVKLGNQRVLVDAGDGSVLQTMQADMEEADDHENETMESEDEGGNYESAENEAGETEGAEDSD